MRGKGGGGGGPACQCQREKDSQSLNNLNGLAALSKPKRRIKEAGFFQGGGGGGGGGLIHGSYLSNSELQSNLGLRNSSISNEGC